MKSKSTVHTVRRCLLSIAAVTVLSIPLVASAGTTAAKEDSDMSLLNSEWQPEIQNDAEAMYGKLKAQSKEVCGSSDLRVTGGLRRSQQIEACYQGTLTAAVQRLDDPDVSELHNP